MIIHKKQSYVKQMVNRYSGKKSKDGLFVVTQTVLKTTWYFLGIPVYSSSEIISSTQEPNMQEFLNTELKPYSELTREEKHVLLDAALDMNVEYTYSHGNSWYSKDSVCVEFYNDTIYRTKPKEYKKLDIPWQHIDEKWKWAAMDGDGEIFLFEDKPNFEGCSSTELWIISSSKGKYANLHDILKLDTTGIVAEHSLTQRPE